MSEVHTRYDEHTGPLPKHSGRDAWTRVQFLSFEAPSDGYGHVSSWHDTSYLGKVPRINNWRAKGEWCNPWWFWLKRYRLRYAKYIQCLPKWPGFDYRWHSNRQSKWLNPLNWWPDKCTPQCECSPHSRLRACLPVVRALSSWCSVLNSAPGPWGSKWWWLACLRGKRHRWAAQTLRNQWREIRTRKELFLVVLKHSIIKSKFWK